MLQVCALGRALVELIQLSVFADLSVGAVFAVLVLAQFLQQLLLCPVEHYGPERLPTSGALAVLASAWDRLLFP